MHRSPPRPSPYVLVSSDHGTMIVSTLDYTQYADGPWGVGYPLLNLGAFDPHEVDVLVTLANLRRQRHGDGVVFLDVGANIGVMTVELARHMSGWGFVRSYEAQERVFYALAGNITINNCFNAVARFSAVGSKSGTMSIPNPDYTKAASYGALELIESDRNEYIGQAVSYKPESLVIVPLIRLDDENLERVDLVKLDVEKMELDVLAGSLGLIKRFLPVFHIETKKNDRSEIDRIFSDIGYNIYALRLDTLYVHRDDPIVSDLHDAGWAAKLVSPRG